MQGRKEASGPPPNPLPGKEGATGTVLPHLLAKEGTEGRFLPFPFYLVVGVSLALGVLYNVASPVFESSDEIWHYRAVKYLAE